MRSNTGLLAFVSALSSMTSMAHAQELGIAIGVGVALDAADGEPANDIPGAGMLVRFSLNDRWAIGAAVNRTEYDFERPAETLGIDQDPMVEVIDALAEATTLRAWIERGLTDPKRPLRFFVGAGFGAAFTDVPDVVGPRADGGTFDIHTEVDTEIIASLLGGARYHFADHCYGETTIRAEHHFAEWRSTDRITGVQGVIDDYLTWGIQFTIAYQW
jgi:hypothetical protein